VRALLLVTETDRGHDLLRRALVVPAGAIIYPDGGRPKASNTGAAVSELVSARVFDNATDAHAAAKRINGGAKE
jgi:hypothetical protein